MALPEVHSRGRIVLRAIDAKKWTPVASTEIKWWALGSAARIGEENAEVIRLVSRGCGAG